MVVYYLAFLKMNLLEVNSEKAMAPHSSTLAWKIPWMKEPDRLQSMGSWRVRRDWATSLSLFTFMHWRRKWQPTPVFLPGESQGWGSLVGCRLWGLTESDTTEATQQQQNYSSEHLLLLPAQQSFSLLQEMTLQFSFGNYIQYLGIVYNGKKSEKEKIDRTDLFCYSPETNQ